MLRSIFKNLSVIYLFLFPLMTNVVLFVCYYYYSNKLLWVYFSLFITKT